MRPHERHERLALVVGTGLAITLLAALLLCGCATGPDEVTIAMTRAANQVAQERAACAASSGANSSACALYRNDQDRFDELLMVTAVMRGGGDAAPAPNWPPVMTTTSCNGGHSGFDCLSTQW